MKSAPPTTVALEEPRSGIPENHAGAPAELVDTHCHLDAPEFSAEIAAVVAKAREQGVSSMVAPSVCAENFDAVARVARDCPGVFPAYGIHPLYTDRAREDDLSRLKERLRPSADAPAPVAVGEIGLDFYVKGVDAARQRYFFTEQLKIAREFDLPVLLHVRGAIDAVMKALRACPASGIAHAFNGSFRQAEAFMRMDFYLGFGGAMTYPGATRLRKLAATLPLERIVLESDAPDMPPVWNAGCRNSPANVRRFAGEIAALRACPLETIARATTQNAQSALRLTLCSVRQKQCPPLIGKDKNSKGCL